MCASPSCLPGVRICVGQGEMIAQGVATGDSALVQVNPQRTCACTCTYMCSKEVYLMRSALRNPMAACHQAGKRPPAHINPPPQPLPWRPTPIPPPAAGRQPWPAAPPLHGALLPARPPAAARRPRPAQPPPAPPVAPPPAPLPAPRAAPTAPRRGAQQGKRPAPGPPAYTEQRAGAGRAEKTGDASMP